MRRFIKIGLAIAVVFLAGAQFVRPARTNPPATGPLPIGDPAAETVLRRSCFDCHSNETRWPWYSGVAPMSWLVVSDVNEGRRELNFSAWRDPKRNKRKEICEQVREGEMPLAIYVPLHPGARLTAADVQTLCDWAARPAPAPPALAGVAAPEDDD